MSTASEGRYATLYEKLADLHLATDEHGDPNPKPLKLSPEAKRLFAEIVDSVGAEMLQPGFPARLEGVWSKLRGHLARLLLVLAVCRCAEDSPGDIREERVERGDVEAASALLSYFAAHARRVYEKLSAPDPLDLLATELRDLLLGEPDRRWEGSATELHEALGERGAAGLPERPEELSKLVLGIGGRSPALEVSQGWRKVGGRKGRSKRVLRLALAENTPENAVGPVVTVDHGLKQALGDNGTNGNNGNSKLPTAGGDDSDYGVPPEDRNEAAGTNPRGPGDGRSRFTL